MGTIVVKQFGVNGNMRGRTYMLDSAPQLLVCAVAHQIVDEAQRYDDAHDTCRENHVTHIVCSPKGGVEARTLTPADALFAAFTFGKEQPVPRGGRLDKATVVLGVPQAATALPFAKVEQLIHKALSKVPGLTFNKRAVCKPNEWFFDNTEFGLDCCVSLEGTPKRPTIVVELC